jgi:hypothetical protein
MTKGLKEYNVVFQYDVQRTYTVYAKDEEQAEELVKDGKAISHDEEETLEIKEVE